MPEAHLKALALLMAFFLTWGCAHLEPTGAPLARMEGKPGHFRAGRIVSLETDKAISFDRLIKRLKSNDIVFIGETHNNPEHHLIQVQILQALTARPEKPVVAVEFFERLQQPVIDRYMAGLINEDVFLKDVAWNRRWGYDYSYYRPIILLIKEKNGTILAINAPNQVVKKVARRGLGSLKPAERRQLATAIDLKDTAHRAYLRETYKSHGHTMLKNFDYFYQAQCVWEETMAENIVACFKKEAKKMVVLTGNGHIINGFGIPNRVLRRSPASVATVLLYPVSGSAVLKKEMADYIWLTGDCGKRRFMPVKK